MTSFADFHKNYTRPSQFQRTVHVWREPAVIWFNNPKVACSSTRASMHLAIAAKAGIDLKIQSMEQVHDRDHNPSLMPSDLGEDGFVRMLGDPGVLRFTFVRDPALRLCSAYLSKLDLDKKGQRQRMRLFEHLGLTADDDLTLEDFVRLCAEDEVVRDFDPHWRLQRKQISYDLVDWSFVGNQATWATDFAYLTEQLFGSPQPVLDTRAVFGRHTPSARLSDGISGSTRARIEMAYAEDYEMLEDIEAKGLGVRR